MSNRHHKREKWREKRREGREEYRVFSSSRPALRSSPSGSRSTFQDWSAIGMDVYKANNMASQSAREGLESLRD